MVANFALMLDRYPNTNIFWCASDQLALETLEQYRLTFDRPIVIGGFDWLPEALSKIQQGKLTASVGGHFLMGAVAISKIFDYEHGIDRFLSDSLVDNFEVITQANVETYLDFIQRKQWQEVNFKQFSAFATASEPKPLTMQNIIKASKGQ
jgi:ABC-type sugar transport system substrate-binding protein